MGEQDLAKMVKKFMRSQSRRRKPLSRPTKNSLLGTLNLIQQRTGGSNQYNAKEVCRGDGSVAKYNQQMAKRVEVRGAHSGISETWALGLENNIRISPIREEGGGRRR